MTPEAVIETLKTLVEPDKVRVDAESLNTWGKDWTKHFEPAPLAIVFPKTVEQVQAVVRFANEHNLALVPSGGRTGLSAAAVAATRQTVARPRPKAAPPMKLFACQPRCPPPARPGPRLGVCRARPTPPRHN